VTSNLSINTVFTRLRRFGCWGIWPCIELVVRWFLLGPDFRLRHASGGWHLLMSAPYFSFLAASYPLATSYFLLLASSYFLLLAPSYFLLLAPSYQRRLVSRDPSLSLGWR